MQGSEVLYTFIILFATLFANFAQSKYKIEGNNVYRTHDIHFYFISFLILVFFSCFSGVGVDRIAYKNMFETYSVQALFNEVEPGFAILILIFRVFTKNGNIFVQFIALITLIFVYSGIWKLRKYLSLSLSVFAFSSQYYLQSFNIMRMYLAMSIAINFAYLLLKQKYTKYFIILIFATTIHYSIVFALIAYVLGTYINLKKIKYQNIYMILFSFIAFVIYYAIQIFISYLVSTIPLLEKYGRYMGFEIGTLGMKWIVNIIPFLLFIVFSKFSNESKHLKALGIGYLTMALLISFVSYSITIVGRGLMTLNMPIVLLLPICIESYRKNYLITCEKFYIKFFNKKFIVSAYLLRFLFIIYLLFSYFMYLKEYLLLDGIANYKFIF